MANCSLTDEEKYKLEKLLAADDSEHQGACSVDIWTKYRTEESRVNKDASDNDSDNNSQMIEAIMSDTNVNAFSLNLLEKRRMEEIDTSLKSHSDSSNSSSPTDEASHQNIISIEDDKYWKLYIMAEGLKEINHKLFELEKQYEEDQLKLGRKTKRSVKINENTDEIDMEEQSDEEVLDDSVLESDLGMTSRSSIIAANVAK